MYKVAKYRHQGWNDTQISKELGIRRVEVKELYNEYKDALSKDAEVRDMARDALLVMVDHFDILIKESYEILSDLKLQTFSHQVAAQMNATLKNISDYEAKRLDAWQKAGLLENSELGDELADMEEKAATLIGILRNDLCDPCKKKVAEKLQSVTNTVEVVVAYND